MLTQFNDEMRTCISMLVVALLLLVGCKPNATKENDRVEPIADTVPVGTPAPHPWQFLKEKLGQYVADSVLFSVPALNTGLESLLKDEYTNLKSDWDVVSPLIMSNNILSISGCRKDDCPASMWVLYIDTANSVINVYHFQNNKLTLYQGKEKLVLPPSMTETLDTLKKNAHVSDSDIKII